MKTRIWFAKNLFWCRIVTVRPGGFEPVHEILGHKDLSKSVKHLELCFPTTLLENVADRSVALGFIKNPLWIHLGVF